MNKIFLIIVLIASSYGYSYKLFGLGASDCSSLLDESRKGNNSTNFLLHVSYAQGVIIAYNSISDEGLFDGALTIMNKKQFEPTSSMIKGLLIEHCNDNKTEDFHSAVLEIWLRNAK